MLRVLVKATPLVAAAVLSNACASAGMRAKQNEGIPCEQGVAVIVVQNNSGSDVQILESRGTYPGTPITVLPTGRHEVRVRNDYSYGYAARRTDGAYHPLVNTRGVRRERSPVTIQRECRAS